MLLTVAVIGPAHALKGEVRLELHTDSPQERLVPGAVFPTDPQNAGPLTISRVRCDGKRWFVTFEQAPDRTAVEKLRGVKLLLDADTADADEDDDAWYAHELIDLTCQTPDGSPLGKVIDLEPGIAQDRLIVRTPQGEKVAVPFVEELVPEIDEEAGVVVIDPPGGLFPGLGESEEAR